MWQFHAAVVVADIIWITIENIAGIANTIYTCTHFVVTIVVIFVVVAVITTTTATIRNIIIAVVVVVVETIDINAEIM